MKSVFYSNSILYLAHFCVLLFVIEIFVFYFENGGLNGGKYPSWVPLGTTPRPMTRKVREHTHKNTLSTPITIFSSIFAPILFSLSRSHSLRWWNACCYDGGKQGNGEMNPLHALFVHTKNRLAQVLLYQRMSSLDWRADIHHPYLLEISILLPMKLFLFAQWEPRMFWNSCQ